MKHLHRSLIILRHAAAYVCLGSCWYAGPRLLAAPLVSQPGEGSDAKQVSASTPSEAVLIPGPLRSFLRMAGISQKVTPTDVLPLLARNVYLHGYQSGKPNEFLRLLQHYVFQARELQTLAGSSETIRVTNCDDAGTLVQILGYRLRQGCGLNNTVLLETANPERAFLTIDSGFPLTELEEALQNGKPFVYPFSATKVPILFHERDWTALTTVDRISYSNQVDLLIGNPSVSRLYWALSKNDVKTSLALQQSVGVRKLLPYAATLDFYGSEICIRSGRVLVPGSSTADPVWRDLVGASPTSPAEFVMRLITKDNGWTAAYFDSLSRSSQAQQAHFTEGTRLKRLYQAFRPVDEEATAIRGVFRKAPEFLLLSTRLQWNNDGEPQIPGGLEVWKAILQRKGSSKIYREVSKHARSWQQPEQLLEGMTALSSLESESGPLQLYFVLSEIDRARRAQTHLSAETVRLLADNFNRFGQWYLIFSEFPDLDDSAIERFINLVRAVDKISNQTLHGNALGIVQANIGLWQIFARQGEISQAELNTSWKRTLDPFSKISSSTQLFDAAQVSSGELLLAAGGSSHLSQNDLIDLIAGPKQDNADGQRTRMELTRKIRTVLADQQLASLDTLFALSEGFRRPSTDGAATDKMMSMAAELREFEMPHPVLTGSEKLTFAPKVYTAHHAELQVRTDLTKVIKGPATHAQQESARGELTSFLRDTLVGLNYAYYEPPGAQVLHTNPLFVRSHDFLGISVTGSDRTWYAPTLLGTGSPSGGAYLMGSLNGLPYALAMAEQEFISPENVQALVWKEMVPNLLVSAILPRWWTVSPNELHAVALYQRFGEELVTASLKDLILKEKVLDVLSQRMSPQRLEGLVETLSHPESSTAILLHILPTDTFNLASEFRRRFPDEAASLGPTGVELSALARKSPTETASETLSQLFGVPHPTLAKTNARELLNIEPFPFFGGYSSQLFGESWESCNLYWARLADELGYTPTMLNSLVPQLTQHMSSKIFATDIEDWPALLRALRETGQDFRDGKIAQIPTASMAASATDKTDNLATMR